MVDGVEKSASLEEFDKAMDVNGFGLFNLIVLLTAFPMACAIIFSTTTIGFVAIQMGCDLHVTPEKIGVLNSITYAGMIFGGLFWAFVSDTFGRRPVIMATHLMECILNNFVALSQTLTQMIVFKFLCGLCISGGYATFLTYLSEVTSNRYRERVVFCVGLMLTLAVFVLPIMALALLTSYWRIDFIGLRYTSWQFYITVTSIPSLAMFVIFWFLPESPKYDMYVNNVDRARNTLMKINRINKGKEEATLDPKLTTRPKVQQSKCAEIRDQFRVFLTSGYIVKAIILCTVEFCVLMCQNTVRLWQPSLFLAISKYDSETHGAFSMCVLIRKIVRKYDKKNSTKTFLTQSSKNYFYGTQMYEDYPIFNIPDRFTAEDCTVKIIPAVFLGQIGMSFISLIAFIITVIIVKRVGPKLLLCSVVFMSFLSSGFLYFAKGTVLCLITFGLYLCSENIASIAILNCVVHIFPTQVRTTTVCFVMIVGRIGSSLGNAVFPKLMRAGCLATVGWIASVEFVAFLASLITPNPRKTKFK